MAQNDEASFSIELGYKGERNYVNGADLVNAVFEHLAGSVLGDIKFSVHDFISTPICTLSFHVTDPKDTTAEFRGTLMVDGIRRWVTINAQSGLPDNGKRSEYDEDLVTSRCVVHDEQIVFEGRSPYTFIETVVSIKKFLLMQRVPPGDKKWIFTAIELDEYQERRDNLAIRILHNFQNKLVKSEIIADGVRVGLIYFSLVKP